MEVHAAAPGAGEGGRVGGPNVWTQLLWRRLWVLLRVRVLRRRCCAVCQRSQTGAGGYRSARTCGFETLRCMDVCKHWLCEWTCARACLRTCVYLSMCRHVRAQLGSRVL